ncbi:unnamed protein product [Schistocephalus solidus]|uniref:Uncharacterized protein n=1 Tax=Schistocephalus solidus TaxID=70667 RepID=A0A3P7CCB6_SCHSO|nr:unnamed protein product [Schistocephalus solidus]
MCDDLKGLQATPGLIELEAGAKQCGQWVSPDAETELSARVATLSTFCETSLHQLKERQNAIASRLSNWQSWRQLAEDLDRELHQFASDLSTVLETSVGGPDALASQQLKEKRVQFESLQALQEKMVALKPQITELKRLKSSKKAAVIDLGLRNRSTELVAFYTKLENEIKSHKLHFKQRWEAMCEFESRLSAVEQWLLTASVKMLALSTAIPDGPRAINCLLRSRNNLVAEISTYLSERIEPLIASTRHLPQGVGGGGGGGALFRGQQPVRMSSGAGSRATEKLSTTQRPNAEASISDGIVRQTRNLKTTARGLLSMGEGIKDNLREKMSHWSAFEAAIKEGEAFLDHDLVDWWYHRQGRHAMGAPPAEDRRARNRKPRKRPKIPASSRTKGWSDAATDGAARSTGSRPSVECSQFGAAEVGAMITQLETRRQNLESLAMRVAAPNRPIITPRAVRERLQFAGSPLDSASTLGDLEQTNGVPGEGSAPVTSGEKMRGRSRTLLTRYHEEEEKLKLLSERMRDWDLRWDQQRLCESETAAWLRSKEAEINQLLLGKPVIGAHEDAFARLAVAFDTSSLQTLRADLLAKRSVLSDLASRRRELAATASEGSVTRHSADLGDTDVEDLTRLLNSLVARIDRGINLRQSLTAEAVNAADLKGDLQEDLAQIFKRVSATDGVSQSATGRLSNLRNETPVRRHLTDSRLLSLDDLREVSSPRARGTTGVHWKLFSRSRDSSPSLFTSGFQDLSTRRDPCLQSGTSDRAVPGTTTSASLEWLWYSPSSIFDDSSTWHELSAPVTPIHDQQNTKGALTERLRSPVPSKRRVVFHPQTTVLKTTGPWTTFRERSRQGRVSALSPVSQLSSNSVPVFPEGLETASAPLSLTLSSQPRASSARLPLTASLGLQIPTSSSPTRRHERQRPALGRFIDLDLSPDNLPGLSPPSLRGSGTLISPLLLRRSFTTARSFIPNNEDRSLRLHACLRHDTTKPKSPDVSPSRTNYLFSRYSSAFDLRSFRRRWLTNSSRDTSPSGGGFATHDGTHDHSRVPFRRWSVSSSQPNFFSERPADLRTLSSPHSPIGHNILPEYASAFRAPSDLARKRYRRKHDR